MYYIDVKYNYIIINYIFIIEIIYLNKIAIFYKYEF